MDYLQSNRPLAKIRPVSNMPIPETGMVISVVDDDASVRLATLDLLNAAGFACEAFSSGEEYFRSGQTERTTCLILDLNMQGMNGLEVQHQVVQSGHDIPIIFITAFPEIRTRAQAIRAGAICYLTKPYSDDELLACLERALGSPS
jgi:FixJ family two-component response regulator